MQRSCSHCGRAFEAKRGTAKYCGSSCRGKATQARQAGAEVVPIQSEPVESGLAGRTEERLRQAGRLDTPEGQLVMQLANRIVGAASDSAVAALSKEYSARLDAVLLGTEESDSLDDMQEKVVEFRRRRA